MVSSTYKISIPGEKCTSCFSTTTCNRSGFLNLRRNSSSCSCFRKKLPVDLIMCLLNHEDRVFRVHQSKLLYLHANLSVIVSVADTPTVYADDPADLCGKADTFSGMKHVLKLLAWKPPWSAATVFVCDCPRVHRDG